METYAFADVLCSIVGPGGAFSIAGEPNGNAEEGIDIEPTGDKNTMTIGADGSGMHSLHGDRSGKITIRLLKTSPINAKLQALYDLQTISGAVHGKNIIKISNLVTGDQIACTQTAFSKAVPLKFAKVGNINAWEFHSVRIDRVLGAVA